MRGAAFLARMLGSWTIPGRRRHRHSAAAPAEAQLGLFARQRGAERPRGDLRDPVKSSMLRWPRYYSQRKRRRRRSSARPAREPAGPPARGPYQRPSSSMERRASCDIGVGLCQNSATSDHRPPPSRWPGIRQPGSTSPTDKNPAVIFRQTPCAHSPDALVAWGEAGARSRPICLGWR